MTKIIISLVNLGVFSPSCGSSLSNLCWGQQNEMSWKTSNPTYPRISFLDATLSLSWQEGRAIIYWLLRKHNIGLLLIIFLSLLTVKYFINFCWCWPLLTCVVACDTTSNLWKDRSGSMFPARLVQKHFVSTDRHLASKGGILVQ